jgi:hypothetical protein
MKQVDKDWQEENRLLKQKVRALVDEAKRAGSEKDG